ncbi:MAG: hypothetical protein WBD29_00610 [Candidatus Competibacter sp.]
MRLLVPEKRNKQPLCIHPKQAEGARRCLRFAPSAERTYRHPLAGLLDGGLGDAPIVTDLQADGHRILKAKVAQVATLEGGLKALAVRPP